MCCEFRIWKSLFSFIDDAKLDAFLKEFRIVTPIDISDPMMSRRKDITSKWRQDIKQEAPFAYKDVTPVIETLKSANIAKPVAEFAPILTVKG